MGTYKGIQGYSIPNLSSDPGTLADVVGQLWYNSSSGKFKVCVQAAGAWSSGPSVNTQRYRFAGGAGTTTSAMIAGGYTAPSPGNRDSVEEYNGTAWSSETSLPVATADTVTWGTQTAAVTLGGNAPSPSNNTQLYNGARWTLSSNTLPWTAARIGGAGTQTAGIAAGGDPAVSNSAEWNGTAWTDTGAYPANGSNLMLCGTQTATLGLGGGNPGIGVTTYNGSTWTVNPASMSNARGEAGYSTQGTQTASMVVNGPVSGPSATSMTESFNGTSWTEIADMSTARSSMGSCGTQANMMCISGSPNTTATEVWDGAPVTAKIVTVS